MYLKRKKRDYSESYDADTAVVLKVSNRVKL